MDLLRLDPDNREAIDLLTRVEDVSQMIAKGKKLMSKDRWDAAIEIWKATLIVCVIIICFNGYQLNFRKLIDDLEEEGRGGLVKAYVLYKSAVTLMQVRQRITLQYVKLTFDFSWRNSTMGSQTSINF